MQTEWRWTKCIGVFGTVMPLQTVVPLLQRRCKHASWTHISSSFSVITNNCDVQSRAADEQTTNFSNLSLDASPSPLVDTSIYAVERTLHARPVDVNTAGTVSEKQNGIRVLQALRHSPTPPSPHQHGPKGRLPLRARKIAAPS